MARTTIILDDDLLLEVRQVANTNKTTIRTVVEEALRSYLEKVRPPNNSLPSFVGMVDYGRGDLSSRDEEILGELIEEELARDRE